MKLTPGVKIVLFSSTVMVSLSTVGALNLMYVSRRLPPNVSHVRSLFFSVGSSLPQTFHTRVSFHFRTWVQQIKWLQSVTLMRPLMFCVMQPNVLALECVLCVFVFFWKNEMTVFQGSSKFWVNDCVSKSYRNGWLGVRVGGVVIGWSVCSCICAIWLAKLNSELSRAFNSRDL